MSNTKATTVSDESWVISAIGWTLLVGLACIFVGWKYNQHMTEQAEKQREGRAAAIYNDYVSEKVKARPAAPAPQGAQTPQGATKAAAGGMTIGERLLSAPGFSAGPGFASEGVQETGTVILDAIERAQAGATKAP